MKDNIPRLKIATVFSGIGSAEFALKRIGIEYDVVFACDNGDVDVLSKKIEVDLVEINEELISLETLIKKIKVKANEEDEYKIQLDTMLDATKNEYTKTLKSIEKVKDVDSTSDILDVIEKVIHMDGVKKSRVKEYADFAGRLKKNNSKENKILISFMCILDVINDYKKDNALSELGKEDVEFTSTEGIDWKEVSPNLKKAYDIEQKTIEMEKRILEIIQNKI